MTGPSLHERLRAATAPAHAALERDLDWRARVATRAGYRALLARLYGFHAVYEPAIDAGLADEPFFGPRRRLHRLEADLRHLGLPLDAAAALPRPEAILAEGPAAAMGALYVLEGSTLGGLVIGAHIGRLHGLSAEGLAYYRAHGRDSAAMWAAFRRRLDAGSDPEATLRAGIATFEAMRDWLCAAPGSLSAAPDAPGTA
ncbi:biliverdin-producing heme oxygenase [Methylobacterium sp. A54F]